MRRLFRLLRAVLFLLAWLGRRLIGLAASARATTRRPVDRVALGDGAVAGLLLFRFVFCRLVGALLQLLFILLQGLFVILTRLSIILGRLPALAKITDFLHSCQRTARRIDSDRGAHGHLTRNEHLLRRCAGFEADDGAQPANAARAAGRQIDRGHAAGQRRVDLMRRIAIERVFGPRQSMAARAAASQRQRAPHVNQSGRDELSAGRDAFGQERRLDVLADAADSAALNQQRAVVDDSTVARKNRGALQGRRAHLRCGNSRQQENNRRQTEQTRIGEGQQRGRERHVRPSHWQLLPFSRTCRFRRESGQASEP